MQASPLAIARATNLDVQQLTAQRPLRASPLDIPSAMDFNRRPMAQEQVQAPIYPRSGATIFSVQSTAQQAHSDATEHGASHRGNDENRPQQWLQPFSPVGPMPSAAKMAKHHSRLGPAEEGTELRRFFLVLFSSAQQNVQWNGREAGYQAWSGR